MLDRAYSLLHIKSVDADQRIIKGTATTPEPDRVGDVVEPLGVSYRNPLPLLLYHDSKKPVGHVRFQKPTAKGIEFEARLPVVDDPGTVRDRVEEAWTSIKTGLIAGVSIGFRAIEQAFNKETNGFHFLKTEVVELSLVTVPAHPGATIHTIKALDLEQQAALRAAVPLPAGVPALPRPAGRMDNPMTKNTNEQIVDLQNSRVAIGDRMKAIMALDASGEGDLTAEQQTEYDGLEKSLDATDTRLRRLLALERANVATQVLAESKGLTPNFVSWSGHQVTVSEPELPPGIAFTRAAICKIASRLDYRPSWEIAKERYPSHPSISQYLKTAIPGGTTTGTGSGSPGQGWGVELATQNSTFVAGFMDYLRPRTIVGRLNLTRTPFNVRIQSQTTGGSASWVGQAVQKPVTFFDFDVTTLGFCKLAAIVVLSEELIRFSTPNAETRVRDQIAEAIIAKMDTDFIDPDVAAVANVSPASITRGITVRTPAGTSLANAMTDIQTMVNAFIVNNQKLNNMAWIMPESVALSLSLMLTSLGNPAFPTINVNGGTLAGFPVVTSQYAYNISTSPSDGNLVILVNCSEIFLADDGQVSIDASNQASIEMSDNPATDTGTVVSMYQTNQVAIRAERFVNWVRGRTSAVEMLGDVRWSA